MSMGTRAGATPANRITPEIVPVLAASMARVPAARVSADSRGGFDLLHPPTRAMINVERAAELILKVIDDRLGKN